MTNIKGQHYERKKRIDIVIKRAEDATVSVRKDYSSAGGESTKKTKNQRMGGD